MTPMCLHSHNRRKDSHILLLSTQPFYTLVTRRHKKDRQNRRSRQMMNKAVFVIAVIAVACAAAAMEGDETLWLPSFSNIVIDESATKEAPCFFDTFPEELLDTRGPDTLPAESYCTTPAASSSSYNDPLPGDQSSSVSPTPSPSPSPIPASSESVGPVDPGFESSSLTPSPSPVVPESSSEDPIDPVIESSSSTGKSKPEPEPQPQPQPGDSEGSQAAGSTLSSSATVVLAAVLIAVLG